MDKIKTYLVIVAGIVIIIGLPLVLIQMYRAKASSQNNGPDQAANFLLEFNNELRNTSTSYSQLIGAIAKGDPIFAAKGGGFADEGIDNYLVMWNLLYSLTSRGLIPRDLAYDNFAHDVKAAYCNQEIKGYVLQARKQDSEPSEYGGFTDLARSFLKQDKNDKCSADFIDPKDE